VAQVELARQEVSEQRRAQAPTETVETGLASRRLLLAATVLMLVMFAVRPLLPGGPPHEEIPAVAQVLQDKQQEQRDGGSAGLGEGISSASVTEATEKMPSYEAAGFAKEVPTKPWAWQRRPPCKSWEVVINGGCWYEATARVKPPCTDGYFEWQGACYMPVMGTPRVPTSNEP
jgi:hypothetical protein